MVHAISREDKREIKKLLTPSWLSGLLTVILALSFSIGAVVIFSLNNSSIKQQLLVWQLDKPQAALTMPGQSVPVAKVTLANTWPLLIIWGAVGLIIYVGVLGVARSVKRAGEVKKSLKYVNAEPEFILENLIERLAIRAIAFILLVTLLYLTVKSVVPYAITATLAAASNVKSIASGLYILLSFSVIAISVHLSVIFVRLAIGRTRLFYES